MSIISELASKAGVIVAGEYSYRGDRFSYEGELNEEMARWASIMCRATTMGVHMQSEILDSVVKGQGFMPTRGWVVKGAQFSVCVIANVFCFIDNNAASINDVVKFMTAEIDIERDKLI